MATAARTTSDARRVTFGQLAKAWLTAAAISGIANVVLGLVAKAILDTPNFGAFDPPPILISNTIFTLLATLLFAVLLRRSVRPVSRFRTLALVAMVLSFAMPLSILTYDNPRFEPANAGTIGVLILMHVVTALTCIGVFSALGKALGKR